MIEEDDKCRGKLSSDQILGIRIGLSVALVVLIVVSVLGCYRVIRKPPPSSEYESLDTRH
jgi:hypothetical protein